MLRLSETLNVVQKHSEKLILFIHYHTLSNQLE